MHHISAKTCVQHCKRISNNAKLDHYQLKCLLLFSILSSLDQGDNSCGDSKIEPADFRRLIRGGMIGNSAPLSTEAVRSASLCAVYCVIHPRCASFDFLPGRHQCRLHDLNSTGIEMVSNDDSSINVIFTRFL